MWIQIADPDPSKTPWTGKVAPPVRPGASWTFELIRPIDSFEDLYSASPFGERRTVTGLLDLQRPSTLVRPRVLTTSPGTLGVGLTGLRTMISGEFDALLSGLAVEDPDEPRFQSLAFASETLTAWLARNDVTHTYDDQGGLAIQAEAKRKDIIDLPGWATATLRSQTLVHHEARSSSLRASSTLHLELAQPATLEEAYATAVSIERLLGFLVGYRGEFPRFRLWAKAETAEGPSGDLQVSGLDWREGEFPYAAETLTTCGLGGLSLETALRRFNGDRASFLGRIYALEFARQFSRNLNDRFAAIMPILEKYLRRRYVAADEADYLDQEKAFFDWIEQSPNASLHAFARKHVRIEARKSPSLAVLLERAIEHVNAKGFNFPVHMAKRIQQRRGALAHSAPDLTGHEVMRFSLEEKAATGLLLLHTLEDLGLDLLTLAANVYPIRDLAWFLQNTREAERARSL